MASLLQKEISGVGLKMAELTKLGGLELRIEDIMDEDEKLKSCIILGFTRDGLHLLSYTQSATEASDGKGGISVQLWGLHSIGGRSRRIWTRSIFGSENDPAYYAEHQACEPHLSIIESQDSTMLIVHLSWVSEIPSNDGEPLSAADKHSVAFLPGPAIPHQYHHSVLAPCMTFRNGGPKCSRGILRPPLLLENDTDTGFAPFDQKDNSNDDNTSNKFIDQFDKKNNYTPKSIGIITSSFFANFNICLGFRAPSGEGWLSFDSALLPLSQYMGKDDAIGHGSKILEKESFDTEFREKAIDLLGSRACWENLAWNPSELEPLVPSLASMRAFFETIQEGSDALWLNLPKAIHEYLLRWNGSGTRIREEGRDLTKKNLQFYVRFPSARVNIESVIFQHIVLRKSIAPSHVLDFTLHPLSEYSFHPINHKLLQYRDSESNDFAANPILSGSCDDMLNLDYLSASPYASPVLGVPGFLLLMAVKIDTFSSNAVASPRNLTQCQDNFFMIHVPQHFGLAHILDVETKLEADGILWPAHSTFKKWEHEVSSRIKKLRHQHGLKPPSVDWFPLLVTNDSVLSGNSLTSLKHPNLPITLKGFV